MNNTSLDYGCVAYIIVCWNNKDLLEECINSILEQDYTNKKIIFVDNDSRDGSAEFVKKKFPSVIILRQPDNYGFAKGNNIGIKHALTDDVSHIVLLNTDARLAKNWTSTLVNFAEKNNEVATLQSVTLDYYDKNVIDSTHIYISRNGQGTQGSYRKATNPEIDVVATEVFGCNAAAILITRKFIDAQPFKKLFDEQMFMYLEDVDVAARATVLGWHNYVLPGTKAYHMGSASSGKNPGFSLYMTYRNNARLLFVNLPFSMFVRIMPSVLRGDKSTIRHLQMVGNHESAEKVRKGRTEGLIKLPLAIPRAITMQLKRKITRDKLWGFMEKGF